MKDHKKEKTEKELLEEISKKIDKLIGVLAIQDKEQKTQIQILTSMGFLSTEVATLTGITPENVRQINSREKNRKNKYKRIKNNETTENEIRENQNEPK